MDAQEITSKLVTMSYTMEAHRIGLKARKKFLTMYREWLEQAAAKDAEIAALKAEVGRLSTPNEYLFYSDNYTEYWDWESSLDERKVEDYQLNIVEKVIPSHVFNPIFTVWTSKNTYHIFPTAGEAETFVKSLKVAG